MTDVISCRGFFDKERFSNSEEKVKLYVNKYSVFYIPIY
jgi:hypothetical protein